MIKYEASDLFKQYEDILRKSVRKCNEITFTPEKTKPWESKLGGCPYLEDIKDYPLDDNGKPMMFLAQLNLSDLIGLDGMPEKGLLQFYIHNDDCCGFNGPCKVIYIESYITDESKLRNQNPYEEAYSDYLPFDKEGKMHFEEREMPISCSLENFEDIFSDVTLTEEQEDKMWEEFDSAGSRVFGYPYFVQSEPAYYEEYNILLLQLDVDDNCGIMFGDSGNCNFFISEEDLKNRNFSKVEYDWQCC